MPDSCDCINIKVNVSLKEPKLNGKLDPKCETILCSDGEDYKRGYDDGHAQGLIDGRADGYESGYKEGHKVGSETGYQTGKNEGLTEGYGNGYAQGNAVGYKAGYDEGYQKGYTEGYEKGLADGTKEEQEKYVIITENGTTEILPDENKVLSKVTVEVDVADSFYDDFWDTYQENGERTNYEKAFNNYWDDSNFKPKYNIVPTIASEMFVGFKGKDIGALLKESNVVLDFSKCTNFYYTFANNWNITKLPVIDCSSATRLNTTFYSCGALHTIEKIIVNRNITSYYITFVGMTNLKNIIFEGEIAATISFVSCSKLSMDSVNSIGTCCIDLTGQDSQTVTFHKNVIAKMSDEQKAVFTNKNWTIASST